MTKLLSLDLATLTGFCFGVAGSRENLIVGHWNLSALHPDLVPGNLAYELRMLFKERGPPDFMAIEKTLHPSQQRSGRTIQSQERLHGAALGVAGMYRVPQVLEVAPATARAHFIGRANMGDSKSTKAAVFKQATLLGYPVTTTDESDSVALWDFVSYVTLRAPPRELRLT